MLFEEALRYHEAVRHSEIVAKLRPRLRPWRMDDDGYMPPAKAAEAMAIPLDELISMVRGGLLEWEEIGGEVWVRPAIVSVGITQKA